MRFLKIYYYKPMDASAIEVSSSIQLLVLLKLRLSHFRYVWGGVGGGVCPSTSGSLGLLYWLWTFSLLFRKTRCSRLIYYVHLPPISFYLEMVFRDHSLGAE